MGVPLIALNYQPETAMQGAAQMQQMQAGQQNRQINQEQLKAIQLENQQRQQQAKAIQQQQQDQQVIQQAIAANPGKTLGDVLPSLQGKISQPSWDAAMEADQKIRKTNADMTEAEFKTHASQHAAYQQIYDGVMDLPDDQMQQAWPQIAQQVDSIPGNKIKLDPSQPMPKAQFQQFGPFLGMNGAYLNQEQAKRANQAKLEQEQALTEKTKAETQNLKESGGTSTDSTRFVSDYLKTRGLPNIPANRQTAFAAFTKMTKTDPGVVRAEVFAGMREYPVINKQTGQLEMRNANDINKSAGNYAPAGEGAKAMGKSALIEDIRGNIGQVRQSLQNPKMPEFTAGQRAQIAVALGAQDSSGALTAAFRGGVLGSLTNEQQDYLINMAQLKENAMAMRSVLGAGQGSEDMRAAITATIPGPRTPSKAYAGKQLDAFEKVLNRLAKGVPGMPLNNAAPQGGNSGGAGAVTKQYQGHTYAQQSDGSWKLSQ